MDIRIQNAGRSLQTIFEHLRERALFPDELLNLLEKVIKCQLEARMGLHVGDLSEMEHANDESIRQGTALVRRKDMPI